MYWFEADWFLASDSRKLTRSSWVGEHQRTLTKHLLVPSMILRVFYVVHILTHIFDYSSNDRDLRVLPLSHSAESVPEELFVSLHGPAHPAYWYDRGKSSINQPHELVVGDRVEPQIESFLHKLDDWARSVSEMRRACSKARREEPALQDSDEFAVVGASRFLSRFLSKLHSRGRKQLCRRLEFAVGKGTPFQDFALKHRKLLHIRS
mmetsp:Transcript_21110/g.52640  ORF Transcript_21110/g.52640 Transcript_21110/m.52640 type:complete len:207 (-) Transcript_21110:443-1063(-)